MGSESELKTWVSDKLMSLMGYSHSTLVQYVIGLAKKASSPDYVLEKLLEYGFTSSNETSTFSKEIYSRVPRKSSGTNIYAQQEREAAMLIEKQKDYKMLDADDEDDEDGRTAMPSPRKVAISKKRFRRKTENEDDDDDTDV